MSSYDDYVAARDYADDCFKVMLDLWRESITLRLGGLIAVWSETDVERVVREQRTARAGAAYEAACDICARAEEARHRAFDHYLETVKT